MFASLGQLVARHWRWVIAGWIVVLVLLRVAAPRWHEVTLDGDFAYLPAEMPSVVGERWLAAAFPGDLAKSQMVVAVVRKGRPMGRGDIMVAYDLIRRMKNIAGAASLARVQQLDRELAEPSSSGDEFERLQQARDDVLATAEESLDEAIRLDELLDQQWQVVVNKYPNLIDVRPPRLAAAYFNRASVHQYVGQSEQAANLRHRAQQLDPELRDLPGMSAPPGIESLPIVDVWTWHNDVFGEKLISRDQQARLIVLQLSNEFMATDNVRVLKWIEDEIAQVRRDLDRKTAPGLEIGLSGSAAVGGDLIRSAAESIRNTELYTIAIVLVILAGIYRSPVLVSVPLITIIVALFVATDSVALLTQVDRLPGFDWWTLKIFTTTRIFVVVILFGAGTDYCLFLISRYKEYLQSGMDRTEATAAALSGVGEALTASALTTVVGLGTMAFADFGKFRYSGPVIGWCLLVTLATCLTFAPALLQALGNKVFWPFPPPAGQRKSGSRWSTSFWSWVSRCIVARPGLILCGSLLVMSPLAGYGIRNGQHVTYDFLSELAPTRPSREGTQTLRQHFPIGESGPLTVLIRREQGGLDSDLGQQHVRALSQAIWVDGVAAIRSSQDPLGQLSKGTSAGITALKLRVLRADRRTSAIFVAQSPQAAGKVTRLELILDHDPFSLSAVETVARVEQQLQRITTSPNSFWRGSSFAFTGTSAAIRDLREVTKSDNRRIQLLVVLSVLGVLLLILRRPILCIYMILSVLFSYYVTVGITQWFFAWMYGSTFHGLDWKVPLFLFVILVAVGQDYNVYLTTRVLEEQSIWGPISGLRRAVVRTGGIITSCGVIMAGTFASMTTGSWDQWLPAFLQFGPANAGTLRGIAELGFALSLGVMLDTFVVRPILVPAFLAWTVRWQAGRRHKATAAPGARIT